MMTLSAHLPVREVPARRVAEHDRVPAANVQHVLHHETKPRILLALELISCLNLYGWVLQHARTRTYHRARVWRRTHSRDTTMRRFMKRVRVRSAMSAAAGPVAHVGLISGLPVPGLAIAQRSS